MKAEAELRRLKEIYDEETLTKKHVEVEIVHDGHSTLYWSRLRRIGRGEVDGIAAESWETVEGKGDTPTRFTVFTGSEGLFAHMEDVNYMHTAHGNKVVMSVVMAGLVFLDLLLMAMMLGTFSSTPDLSQWYFVGPMFGVGALVASLLIISERSIAKILTIECACPHDESGAHHVCYLCHSRVSNVVQQLDAMKTSGPIFERAIDKLKDELTARRVFEHDRILWLEAENQRLSKEAVNAGGQKANTYLMMGDRSSRSIGMPAWMVFLLVAVVAVAAVGMTFYFGTQGG